MAATGPESATSSEKRFVLVIVQNKATFPCSALVGVYLGPDADDNSPDPGAPISSTKPYGKAKPPNIVLQGVVDTEGILAGWHAAGEQGMTGRHCVLNEKIPGGTTEELYSLAEAWPAKLEGSVSAEQGGGVRYGSVEMACRSITPAKGPADES